MAGKKLVTLVTPVRFDNLGSLITIYGTDQLLGHLLDCKEHGVYEPTYGRVPIDPQYVDAHNAALDKAMVEGLDGCQIKQGGSFYLNAMSQAVKTFTGILVSDDVNISSNVVTFRRNGKTFRGRYKREGELFNFRRIK